ncbi:MAG: hypothetical protein QOG53_3614 [Frankiales bacterium]|nr:hypothetical protein [Frankiales bacterium]
MASQGRSRLPLVLWVCLVGCAVCYLVSAANGVAGLHDLDALDGRSRIGPISEACQNPDAVLTILCNNSEYGGVPKPHALVVASDFLDIAGLLSFVSLLLFFRWLYVSQGAARAPKSQRRLARSPFIPVYGYAMARRAMIELWESESGRVRGLRRALLNGWWVLYIVVVILQAFSHIPGGDNSLPPTVSELESSTTTAVWCAATALLMLWSWAVVLVLMLNRPGGQASKSSTRERQTAVPASAQVLVPAAVASRSVDDEAGAVIGGRARYLLFVMLLIGIVLLAAREFAPAMLALLAAAGAGWVASRHTGE